MPLCLPAPNARSFATLAGRLSLSQLALGWQRVGTSAPLEWFRVHEATDGRIDRSPLPATMKQFHCLRRLYFFLLQLAQRLVWPYLDQIVILIIFFIYIALIKTEIVPHIVYKELIKKNKPKTRQNQPLKNNNLLSAQEIREKQYQKLEPEKKQFPIKSGRAM